MFLLPPLLRHFHIEAEKHNKLPRSKLRGIKRKNHCLGAKQASGNRTLQGIEIRPLPKPSPRTTLEASPSPILQPLYALLRAAPARCRCMLGPQLSPQARGGCRWRRGAGWRRENAV
jgi:hypothetical protein